MFKNTHVLLFVGLLVTVGGFNSAFAGQCRPPDQNGWFTCCSQTLTGDHPDCHSCHYNSENKIECKLWGDTEASPIVIDDQSSSEASH